MKENHTESAIAGEKQANSSRRQFIKKTAAATVVAASPFVLQKYARAAARPIKIGFVTPKTGVLSPFGDCDDFVLSGVRKALSGGIMVNGTNHPVQIIVKDSQSDTSRSAEVAAELIKANKVDLLVSACHVNTINPTCDQAEVNGVPCITTDCPWQPYFFGRGGNPQKGFVWTYHFFWGLEDDVAVDLDMWASIPTNKVVGALWPNDTSGIAYSDPEHGFPKPIKEKGFRLVDPGRFDYNTPDFSAQIYMFKQEKVEIVHGILSASVFANFWNQAQQQNFKPKIVTMAAALLFPAAVNALGEHGTGLTAEVNWSPGFPFKSGLTGQTSAQLCNQWEQVTGKQWTQPIGHKHALFEVAVDALKRTKNIDSPKSILDAICTTNYNSIVGHVQWPGQMLKNISKTPLVGGQWVRGKKYKYDLVIVSNSLAKEIPKQSPLKAL